MLAPIKKALGENHAIGIGLLDKQGRITIPNNKTTKLGIGSPTLPFGHLETGLVSVNGHPVDILPVTSKHVDAGSILTQPAREASIGCRSTRQTTLDPMSA